MTPLDDISSIHQKVAILRKNRIAQCIENINDPIDTPFEAEVFFSNSISAIDTPIEFAISLKSRLGQIRTEAQDKATHHEETDDEQLDDKPRGPR